MKRFCSQMSSIYGHRRRAVLSGRKKMFLTVIPAFFFFCLAAGPVMAAAVPVILPGTSFTFSLPDNIEGNCDTFLPLLTQCIVDSSAPLGSPLSSFVRASEALSRAEGTIFQYHDFELDPGSNPDAVLLAQVSGSVNIRGFMALIGVGRVSSDIVVHVMDITNISSPAVIKTYRVSEYELQNEYAPQLGISGGVQAGAPYAGASVSLAAGFNILQKKQLIRDSLSFGFDVLLQRGHRYRLQLESSSSAKLGIEGLGLGLVPKPLATAIVSFYDFQVPNLIQSFLDITDGQSAQGLKLPVLDNLPTKSLLTNGSSFHFPALGLGVSFTSFGLLGGDVDLNLPLRVSRTFNDANELFQKENISTDLRQFIEHFFDFANAEGSEENISSPGVQETRLSIMVQQDQVELLNEIINLLKTPQGRRDGFPLK